jgi:hypothetical protein
VARVGEARAATYFAARDRATQESLALATPANPDMLVRNPAWIGGTVRSKDRRLTRSLAVTLVAAGMMMASTGLAVTFGVIATTVFDLTWNGMYVGATRITINGRELPETATQTLLIALPLLMTASGVAFFTLGWRGCRTFRVSRTMAAHRS